MSSIVVAAIVVETSLGNIVMCLLEAQAPATCNHVKAAIASGVFDDSSFYRSDFVIQFGLHGTGKSVAPALQVNESTLAGAKSNTKGAGKNGDSLMALVVS